MRQSVAPRLRNAVSRYPAAIRDGQFGHVSRIAFEVDLVRSRLPAGAIVCDVGGGWGTFAIGCALAGLRPVLIDDFRDPGFFDEPTMNAMRDLWRLHGLEVLTRDVVADGLGSAPASLDAVTSFDSLEHWHNSPKALLHEIAAALKPRGLLLIGTPNCANLRKRLSSVLGRVKWTSMEDWYEQAEFRGHVREPDVGDLRYIARDIGLEHVEVVGRNWHGYSTSRPRWIRAVTPLVDYALRLRPSLCANIYMIGTTPRRAKANVTPSPSPAAA